MSRQFSGSNLWLDLPLNLLQAQSTVDMSRTIDTLTPIISPPCRSVRFPTDALVSAVMPWSCCRRETLQMPHTRVLTVAMLDRRDLHWRRTAQIQHTPDEMRWDERSCAAICGVKRHNAVQLWPTLIWTTLASSQLFSRDELISCSTVLVKKVCLIVAYWMCTYSVFQKSLPIIWIRLYWISLKCP